MSIAPVASAAMIESEHLNSRQYLSFILAGEEYASDI